MLRSRSGPWSTLADARGLDVGGPLPPHRPVAGRRAQLRPHALEVVLIHVLPAVVARRGTRAEQRVQVARHMCQPLPFRAATDWWLRIWVNTSTVAVARREAVRSGGAAAPREREHLRWVVGDYPAGSIAPVVTRGLAGLAGRGPLRLVDEREVGADGPLALDVRREPRRHLRRIADGAPHALHRVRVSALEPKGRLAVDVNERALVGHGFSSRCFSRASSDRVHSRRYGASHASTSASGSGRSR